MEKSTKQALPAFILCFLFGTFGLHRLYVGKIGTAFLQLITLGGFGFWTLWDLIMILFGKFEDKEGKVLSWE